MRALFAVVSLAACGGPIYQDPANVPHPEPAPAPVASAPAPLPTSPGPAPTNAPPPPPAQSGMTTLTSEKHAVPLAGGAAPAAAAQPAYAKAIVDAHNRYRAKHCAGPLAWSPQLATVAQTWANSLRDKGCMFGHSGANYGENLAAGTTGTLTPESVAAMWYDEIAKYKFPAGGFSMTTGHFTQVVWKSTTAIGCGVATCNGMDIWVCNYDPAGNVDGQYPEQVKPVGCK